MTTDPFDPSAAQLLAQTHQQTFRIAAEVGGVVYDLDLEDEGWSLDWTETRTPRVAGDFPVAVPDEAVVAALDPRTLVWINCYAGYYLPSGDLDEHRVARLILRSRTVSRPDNVMTLVATSAECLVLDASPDIAVPLAGTTTYSSASACIVSLITTRLSTGPLAGPSIVSTTSDPDDFTADALPGDFWSVIEDAADAMDAVVFDNGDVVFRIEPRRYRVAATSDVVLTVGSNGTILTSTSDADRDEWANVVTIEWSWTNADDTPGLRYGQAFVDGGPYAPANAGLKVYMEKRDSGYITLSAAKRVAKSVLQRMLMRSRRLRIEAVAAWWLRPGMTGTVQLPTGAQTRHLIASVAFRPGGMMVVETRLPDTASTIGE